VSADLLLALQEAHAFDPFPVRDDLGLYHVPFSELAGDGLVEQALGDGCRRYERIAIVGDSGTGKSSLTASVLGPLAEGVAPVVVPVAIEPNETVSEPRAMFAHIAAVIARVAADAAALTATEREQALARLTSQRPVGRVGGRSLRLGGGWMGANVSAELARQAGPQQSIDRSAAETLEVVEQMLTTIHGEALVPVLVFDDTDRWLSGSFRDHEDLARSFFGAAEQVGPRQVAREQRTTGQQHRRVLADRAVVQEERHVLGRVAGRVEHLDAQLADLEHLAVGERAVLVAEIGCAGAQQVHAAGSELAETAQVVVVAVRVEREADAQPPFSGGVEVAGHVPLGVEDERLAGLVRADEIGRMAESLDGELPEEHEVRPWVVRAAGPRTTARQRARRRRALGSAPAAAAPTPSPAPTDRSATGQRGAVVERGRARRRRSAPSRSSP